MTLNGESVEMPPLVTVQSDNYLLFAFAPKDTEQMLYLTIPVDAKAGDVIDAAWSQREQRTDCYVMYSENANVSFKATTDARNSFAPSPVGSSFRITVDEISADGRTYSGTFEAVTSVSDNDPFTRTFKDGRYHITLDDIDMADIAKWQAAQSIGSVPVTTTQNPQSSVAALILPEDGYGEWETSGNEMKFRAQVKNNSSQITVISYELIFYTEDSNESVIGGEAGYISHSTKQTVKPGATVYSDYVTLPNLDKIVTVNCAVYSATYADGTTVINPELEIVHWNVTK